MKTLLILVMAVLLAGGSWLSKPSQDNFIAYIGGQTQPAQPQTMQTLGKSIIGQMLGTTQAPVLLYHDHMFWATEDLNGKAQYVGAFSHWWKLGTPAVTTATPAT